MNRTWIRIANGALLVLCCFLVARVIVAFAGEALVPETALAAVPPPQPASAPRHWADRQVIIDRALLGSPGGAVAPPPPDDEVYEDTKLSLELLGTVAAGDAKLSWAAVLDRDTRKHLVVRIGDRLKDRAEVIGIDRKRIVLQNGPRREQLALAEDEVGKPKPPTRRSARATRPARRAAAAARERPEPSVDVERLAQNRFAVPRDDLQPFVNNPAALFSQARILPKYQDGEMVGMQLNAIKPGSFLEEIGMQDGDTITEINGIEVTGTQASAEVLQELAEAFSNGTSVRATVTGADGAVRQVEGVLQ